MKTIALSDIIILDMFKKTTPNKNKMDYVRKYAIENGKLDRPIVLNNKVLKDGYIRYLVAKELKFDRVPYVKSYEKNINNSVKFLKVTYIVGKFKNNKKRYVWKLTKDIDVNVGDKVLVRSKVHGQTKYNVINVVKVFESSNPKLLRHNVVIGKVGGSDG